MGSVRTSCRSHPVGEEEIIARVEQLEDLKAESLANSKRGEVRPIVFSECVSAVGRERGDAVRLWT